jgi:hypothetical protein
MYSQEYLCKKPKSNCNTGILRCPPAPTVWTHLFKNSLGSLLGNFNRAQILTKDAVNPRSQENQKNSCSSGKLVLTNLKRSGFVFITMI